MVSNPPLIFNSSSLCTNHLVTVLSAPITFGITIIFMVHSFSKDFVLIIIMIIIIIIIIIVIYCYLSRVNRHIDPVGRVFANGTGDLGSIPKTLKMVLDTSLFNTQQYKVRIKGKVEQSRERSSALPYTSE